MTESLNKVYQFIPPGLLLSLSAANARIRCGNDVISTGDTASENYETTTQGIGVALPFTFDRSTESYTPCTA